jgi:hypothetical protein
LGKLALTMGIAMNVPYRTKTGLEIGKYYQKDTRPEISADMELIQSIMLGKYESIRRKTAIIYAYFLGITLTIFCLFVFAK